MLPCNSDVTMYYLDLTMPTRLVHSLNYDLKQTFARFCFIFPRVYFSFAIDAETMLVELLPQTPTKISIFVIP